MSDLRGGRGDTARGGDTMTLLDGEWQPTLSDLDTLSEWERRVWARADGSADRGRGIIRCAICGGPLCEHTTMTHADELGWRR